MFFMFYSKLTSHFFGLNLHFCSCRFRCVHRPILTFIGILSYMFSDDGLCHFSHKRDFRDEAYYIDLLCGIYMYVVDLKTICEIFCPHLIAYFSTSVVTFQILDILLFFFVRCKLHLKTTDIFEKRMITLCPLL